MGKVTIALSVANDLRGSTPEIKGQLLIRQAGLRLTKREVFLHATEITDSDYSKWRRKCCGLYRSTNNRFLSPPVTVLGKAVAIGCQIQREARARLPLQIADLRQYRAGELEERSPLS